MTYIPEDLWLSRMKARWAFFAIVLSFFLGAAIVGSDALLNPPVDLPTSSFGALLMGILPVSYFDGLIGRRGEK